MKNKNIYSVFLVLRKMVLQDSICPDFLAEVRTAVFEIWSKVT